MNCTIWHKNSIQVSRSLENGNRFTSTPDVHAIDRIAAASLSEDCPCSVHPVWTLGNGNCMGRSLSMGYRGDNSMHLQIRAWCVIEGILRKEYYVLEEWMNRGASLICPD